MTVPGLTPIEGAMRLVLPFMSVAGVEAETMADEIYLHLRPILMFRGRVAKSVLPAPPEARLLQATG